MRYFSLCAIAVALALGLSNSKAWCVDVSGGASVQVAGGDLNIGFFYEQLAPHGRWIDMPRYGRVWQPSVVLTDENWRPYVNEGRWRYTDAGWYWDSTYAWGWAPFHYGRWSYDTRNKWVWLPDVTWGPAWVTWRHTNDVYGWAPLPFGSRFENGGFVGVSVDVHADLFNFVPAGSFFSVNLGSVVFSRDRASTIYKQTTIINNSYVYNDNRVINNGIPVAEVSKATKQEIKAVPIDDAKAPTEKSGSDTKVMAFRPKLKDEKPKEAATKSGAAVDAPKEPVVPAGHVEKNPVTDPKAKAPEGKTPGTDPKAKAPEGKTPGTDPDAKVPPKENEPKHPGVAPEPKESGKDPESKARSDTPDHKVPGKGPNAKPNEKDQKSKDKGDGDH